MTTDNVNKPSHYQGLDMECRDAIRGMLGVQGFIAYCQGNVLKYLWRHQRKGKPQEDLEKARMYQTWIEWELKPKEKIASLPELKEAIMGLQDKNRDLEAQNLDLIRRVKT